MSARPLKVCVLGLGGGGFHWEAQRILRAVSRPIEVVLVFSGPGGGLKYWQAEETKVVASYVVRSPSLSGDGPVRKLAGTLANVWQALRILRRERPDVVIAVGTAQAVPFGVAARLTGRPLWFVESVTRMQAPSRTGRLIARYGLAARLYYYSKDLAAFLPAGVCMEREHS